MSIPIPVSRIVIRYFFPSAVDIVNNPRSPLCFPEMRKERLQHLRLNYRKISCRSKGRSTAVFLVQVTGQMFQSRTESEE